MIVDSTIIEKEECLDTMRCPAFRKIYIGYLEGVMQEYLEMLVDTGNEEFRFKVQMLREILDLEGDLYAEWKEQKESAVEK